MAEDNPEAAYSIIAGLENKEVRETAAWQIAFNWASREPHRIDEIANLMGFNERQIARLRSAHE